MTISKFVINDHKTLGKVLDAYMESVQGDGIKAKLLKKTLEEKDKQDSVSLKPASDSSNDNSSKTKTDDPEYHDQNALAQMPEFKDIVDKLNAIRAGRSLKDETIESSFEGYFDALKPAEKVALFSFLKGMSQILSGQVSGEHASDPADSPANVKMKKDNNGEDYDPDGDGKANEFSQDSSDKKSGSSKHINPEIVKPKGAPPKKKGGENTSPPIKVK